MIDGAYFASNLLQVPHGGWFPVGVGALCFIVMSTWRRGGELMARQTDRQARSIDELIEALERDKVARVRGRLPQTVDEPVVAKVEADAFPVIWIALSSDRYSPLELTDLANRIAKPVLQTATGVAECDVAGK